MASGGSDTNRIKKQREGEQVGIENRKNGCEIVLAIFPVDSCECSFYKD
jgi:hypothetical protein